MNIRQAMKASSKALNKPNARLTISLNMWREAKDWLAHGGQKPMCRHGAMLERANFNALKDSQ